MLSWLLVVALAFLVGFVSIRAWWIERKKRIVAERRVVERPNSFYASKAVHNQEDEDWWRRIELERLHELNREYVEHLFTPDRRRRHPYQRRTGVHGAYGQARSTPAPGRPPADRPLAPPRLI